MPSLREIEKTIATLWLDRKAREWFLEGGQGEIPASLQNAPTEILKTADKKGISLYGELIAFGHRDVMDSIYPFCQKLLGKKWESVVEDYLLRFPPDHYNFNRLCNRLSLYFSMYGSEFTAKYPFIVELADYEWIELEKQEEDAAIEPHPHEQLATPEQISTRRPLVNPTVTVREYKYNIPELAKRFENGRKIPAKVKEERTLVAIYRHPETQRCNFAEIGDTAARLVEMAKEPISYGALLPIVISLTPELEPATAVAQFLELVEDLQELGIFIGSPQIGD